MIHSDIISVQHTCKLLECKGIRDIVISPGSRNAPFAIECSQNPNFNILSIVDERSAAFFAIGISQKTRKPTAVICTSGSALANYYPAVVEAYYQGLPLLIISADRPREWIDQNDGQTIRQENIFKSHTVSSVNLQKPNDKDTIWYNHRLVNEALNKCVLYQKPVHINVPLEEPLYGTTSDGYQMPKVINLNTGRVCLDQKQLAPYIRQWQDADKKMILVGQVLPNNDLLQKQLQQLSEDPSVVVLTEKTSNVGGDLFISCIDKVISSLTSEQKKNLKPDILITLGGQVVSKRIKALAREYKPKAHWHVDDKDIHLDTYQSLTESFMITPTEFFNSFKPKHKFTSYRDEFLVRRKNVEHKHLEFLKNIHFSDLKVFDIILRTIPKSSVLQLSNSSVVRYVQLFDMGNIPVYCNRGTSGIDGSTSTAVGYAHASDKQTIFISGDISFLYDSNALWNDYVPRNFRVIVLNNSGGGIFRIIANTRVDILEKYLETKHRYSLEHLANMYSFEYFCARDEQELREVLKNFYTDEGTPRILEIFTPREQNDEVLKKYWSEV